MGSVEFDPSRLLRRTRLEAGLTQAELARRAGTTQTAVARLERRGSNPRVATLQRLLGAADVRLGLVAEPPLPAVDRDQVLEHLRLSPADRAARHDAAYASLRDTVGKARRIR